MLPILVLMKSFRMYVARNLKFTELTKQTLAYYHKFEVILLLTWAPQPKLTQVILNVSVSVLQQNYLHSTKQ